jgi:hypothetical protein
MDVSELAGESCEYVGDDCRVYAWELSRKNCLAGLESSTHDLGLSPLSAGCPDTPSPCDDICISCSGGCSLERVVCSEGFCLDEYPDNVRTGLISAIRARNTKEVAEALYDLFDLTYEQRQICNAEWTRRQLSFDYGFVAPQMPEGTHPTDSCFSQLPPDEQRYWSKVHQYRYRCGTWFYMRD